MGAFSVREIGRWGRLGRNEGDEAISNSTLATEILLLLTTGHSPLKLVSFKLNKVPKQAKPGVSHTKFQGLLGNVLRLRQLNFLLLTNEQRQLE